MAKRKRDVPVLFWVSAEELELIHQKMQQYGTENLSAYLRKMALDGYVVKLDLPELKELVCSGHFASIGRTNEQRYVICDMGNPNGINLFRSWRRFFSLYMPGITWVCA